ncbi:MAG: twin-arginine translocase subunit TatC [Candidatus Omnitrophota bacterium]
MNTKRLTFVEHLEELRTRMIKCLIFLAIASFSVYFFREHILDLAVRPVGTLVFISPQEAFIANLKIAFFGGLFLSSPFFIYQIWLFILYGMDNVLRRHIVLLGFVSFVLFLVGSFFGYFLIVPIGLRFLLSFATDHIVPMISVGKYISFVGLLTLVFGVVFELPLAILFLVKLRIVTPKFLIEKRRYAIVIIFIVSAIFTPPDVVTQCLLAIPLLVLYELSILLSKLGKQ